MRSRKQGDGWERSRLGLYLPPKPTKRQRYPRLVAVDLFAGAGGMSLGLHQAGFHVAAAVECDVDAALTYMCNLAQPGVQIHFSDSQLRRRFDKKVAASWGVNADQDGRITGPTTDTPVYSRGPIRAGSGWISHYGCDEPHHRGVGPDGSYSEHHAQRNAAPSHPYGCEHFWIADIHKVTGAEILDALGLEVGEVDLVAGGPPCQGFSTSGKRQVADPRNNLVFEFARLINEVRPRTFLMENVPGILRMVTPDGHPVLDVFTRLLDDGGYANQDALRRSLLATSGAGAAIRSDGTPDPRGRLLEEDDDPEDLNVDMGRTRGRDRAKPSRQQSFDL